jgi:hypothetical protein
MNVNLFIVLDYWFGSEYGAKRQDSTSSVSSFFGSMFNRPVSTTEGERGRQRHKSGEKLPNFMKYGRKETRAGQYRDISADYSGLSGSEHPPHDSETTAHSDNRPSAGSNSGMRASNSNPDLRRPLLSSRDYDYDYEAAVLTWGADDIVFEGYLTKKGISGAFSGESWKSRYFVLRNGGLLYYFKNKGVFKDNPNQALKDKPIQVPLYKVKVSSCYILVHLHSVTCCVNCRDPRLKIAKVFPPTSFGSFRSANLKAVEHGNSNAILKMILRRGCGCSKRNIERKTCCPHKHDYLFVHIVIG